MRHRTPSLCASGVLDVLRVLVTIIVSLEFNKFHGQCFAQKNLCIDSYSIE